MAGSIERRGEDTFRLIVSGGKDPSGKRKVFKKTIKIAEKTEKEKLKRAEKELAKFISEIESDTYIEPTKYTLKIFSEKWIEEYAKVNLSPKTVFRYKGLLERINFSLGHLKLDKIKPMHLIEFYNNLSEKGIRLDSKYQPKNDFEKTITNANFTFKDLIKIADVSDKVITSIKANKHISYDSALKISESTKINFNLLFSIVDNPNGLSPLTIQHHHRLIHAILATAVKWQLIPTNAADFADPPKVQRKEAGFYEEDEISELFKALNKLGKDDLKYKVAIIITITSGVRLGELMGLQWKYVDFNNNTIEIIQSNQYLPNKGTFTKDTKNYTSRRIISLPIPVMDLLKSYELQQFELKLSLGELWQPKSRMELGEPWEDRGFLFTQKNGELMYPGTISSWFPRFLKENDLRRITFHQLRHTSATILINAGLDIKAISKRLGHAKTSTTLDIYGHALKSADKAAADKMSDALFKNPYENKEEEHVY